MQVSLAIRIRPFFENSSAEIREAAILLFGDLFCAKPTSPSLELRRRIESAKSDESIDFSNGHSYKNDPTVSHISDALREQLFSNFMSMLLHLCEPDAQIVRVSFGCM